VRTRSFLLLLLVLAGCGRSAAADVSGGTPYLQANLAGGYAEGAEELGRDDVVGALVAVIEREDPEAVFLNEACESHAEQTALALGTGWTWHFVPAWPGESSCYPVTGSTAARFGNAVLVRTDGGAAAFDVPSCNDAGADPARCLPNWAEPAEQRRGACLVADGTAHCSFHLDPTEWEHHDDQLAAVARIGEDLAAEHGHVVIGADLNVADAGFGPDHAGVSTTSSSTARRPSRRGPWTWAGASAPIGPTGAARTTGRSSPPPADAQARRPRCR
jgi:hypothetical protein